MSWLDPFLNAYNTIASSGVGLPQQRVMNFTGAAVTITDNPNTSPPRTDIAIDTTGLTWAAITSAGFAFIKTIPGAGGYVTVGIADKDPAASSTGIPIVYTGQNASGASSNGGAVTVIAGTGAEGGETDVLGGNATNLAGKAGDVRIAGGGFIGGSPTTGSTGGSVSVDATPGDTNGHIVLRVNGNEAILLDGPGNVYITSQSDMVLETQTLEIEGDTTTIKTPAGDTVATITHNDSSLLQNQVGGEMLLASDAGGSVDISATLQLSGDGTTATVDATGLHAPQGSGSITLSSATGVLSSTSLADVPGASVTITTLGNDVDILLTVAGASLVNYALFSLAVDSTDIPHASGWIVTFDSSCPVSARVSLAAGSHTFKARYKVLFGGSINIDPSADGNALTLTVREVI